MGDILKIDLDLDSLNETVQMLKERIIFLTKINIMSKKDIEKIECIKKTKYSAKIYLNKEFRDKKDLILMQSILGSDYKHTAITFRDCSLGILNFNRLFDIKRYPDGSYLYSKRIDITKQVLKNDKRKKNAKKSNSRHTTINKKS